MKKIIRALCVILCACMLTACMRGKTNEVKIYVVDSDIYTEKDISEAVQTVRSYFERNFYGCSMTELYYIGDEKNPDYREYASVIGADEVIVFESVFTVAEQGAEESLMPGETCTGWKWILGRKKGGDWKHIDHGY
ncbi:MAG: hypothetical protein K6G61_00875 [Solobacterium sp.]|nr:hypothetical protein [Solobacterium sp.]